MTYQRMWKHVQLLLKAMRLHGGQLSSLSLIMDVFETPACLLYIPQGHVRDITTLNRKILTPVTPTRFHSLKKPILYTETSSFHSSHPTYHVTNGIRPHNPQAYPLPFLFTTVLLHNMALRPARPVATSLTPRPTSANLSPRPNISIW